ncbi:helix-turn-helix domain-containing protein [Tumebacillus sp. DT12]|uniref:Helix-turn-helix domain-containing protein n=1 Tax=Tumebacillus lacus TaxID=2995335 RepID=A0ABT3X7X0_9BACL|nr:helix-turn-helix domain-containing protein [Tumebacillus lacus]MCX7572002.1 helix-turn-helix domain-containing protein [Tumebacillus lacus]
MLGAKIRQLRKEKGMSLGELAERADCAKSYLSDIERGVRDNPSIQFLEKIGTVLHVPTEFFIDKTYTTAQALADQVAPEMVEIVKELDLGWLQLTKQAAESGLTQEQFKEFIEYAVWKSKQTAGV